MPPELLLEQEQKENNPLDLQALEAYDKPSSKIKRSLGEAAKSLYYSLPSPMGMAVAPRGAQQLFFSPTTRITPDAALKLARKVATGAFRAASKEGTEKQILPIVEKSTGVIRDYINKNPGQSIPGQVLIEAFKQQSKDSPRNLTRFFYRALRDEKESPFTGIAGTNKKFPLGRPWQDVIQGEVYDIKSKPQYVPNETIKADPYALQKLRQGK